MDNESQAETLRSIYSSAPGKAWRLYRLTLVDTFSGDAAQEACTTPPGNQQSRRSVARHEIGHALAKYLVRGRSGSVAMTSWGGVSGGFDSQADAEVKGFGKTDAQYRAPYETALELAGAADRAARVRAALVRLFGKLWYRASICELGHELFVREYIDETELEAYFAGGHGTPAGLPAADRGHLRARVRGALRVEIAEGRERRLWRPASANPFRAAEAVRLAGAVTAWAGGVPRSPGHGGPAGGGARQPPPPALPGEL